MCSNFSGELPFVSEPGEQIVGQYKTVGVVARDKGADAGVLIITSQRVVYYRKEGVLKKLFKSETPAYTFSTQVPLWGINKIGQGGKKTGRTSYHRFIAINGVRYFLETADSRPMEKMLKASSKAAKTAKKSQISQPVVPMQAPATIPVQAQGSISPTTSKVVICPVCGKENETTSKFCSGCGAKLH